MSSHKKQVTVFKPLVSLLLATCAGMMTWGFIHFQDPRNEGLGLFKVHEKYHIRALGESSERWSAYLEQQRQVDIKNSAVAIGLFGALLGVGMAAVGFGRHSILKLIPMGLIMGAATGAIAGIAGNLLQQHFANGGQISVDRSVYINSTLFGVLGFGLGALSGILSGSAQNTVEQSLKGLVVGLLAGVAYPLIAYLCMANVNIEGFIPRSTAARVLWLGVGTGLLGLFSAWSLGKAGGSALDVSDTKLQSS